MVTGVPAAGEAPKVFNIGNNRGEPVSELVRLLEQHLGRAALLRSEALPVVDVLETCANLSAIEQHVSCRPTTPLALGIPRFVDWFLEFHPRLTTPPQSMRPLFPPSYPGLQLGCWNAVP